MGHNEVIVANVRIRELAITYALFAADFKVTRYVTVTIPSIYPWHACQIDARKR